MELSKNAIVSLVFICLLIPNIGFATLWNYSVVGHVDDPEYSSDIIGSMTISDQFSYYDTPKKPTPIHFNVFEFNLQVGQYSFSGTSGGFMQMFYIIDGKYRQADNMWGLIGANPESDWNNWTGEVVDFYNMDRTLFWPDYFAESFELAPLIKLTSAAYVFDDDPIFSSSPSMTMWLTRGEPAPVPEPSTILLLGGGLFSLALHRRKRKSA